MTFIIALASFIASLLTLYSGFGLGTLLMPVVAVFFPVTIAVAITALVHLLNNLFKLAALWRQVNFRVFTQFGVPAMIASIGGAFLLMQLSSISTKVEYEFLGIAAIITPLKMIVGLSLIFFAWMEWAEIAKRIQLPQKFLPLGGLLSGFFGGLSGHQGASRSVFLLRVELTPSAFVATNAAIAACVDIARLAVYGLNFSLLLQVPVSLLVVTTLAAFAGVLAGVMGLRKVTIVTIQNIVVGLLFILGILLCVGIL